MASGDRMLRPLQKKQLAQSDPWWKELDMTRKLNGQIDMEIEHKVKLRSINPAEEIDEKLVGSSLLHPSVRIDEVSFVVEKSLWQSYGEYRTAVGSGFSHWIRDDETQEEERFQFKHSSLPGNLRTERICSIHAKGKDVILSLIHLSSLWTRRKSIDFSTPRISILNRIINFAPILVNVSIRNTSVPSDRRMDLSRSYAWSTMNICNISWVMNDLSSTNDRNGTKSSMSDSPTW